MTDQHQDESRLQLCNHCGYSLRHLTVNRCPECGQEFDPDDPSTFEVGGTRIGHLDVLRYVLKGVPVSLAHLPMPWARLRPPVFPFLFIGCAALMVAIVQSLWWTKYAPLYRSTPQEVPLIVLSAFCCHFAMISLAFLWQWEITTFILRGTDAMPKVARQGATRVTCFSFALQPFVEIPYSVFFRHSSYLGWGASVYYSALVCFMLASAVKLVYVFQGTRKESTGSVATALGVVVFCPESLLCAYCLFLLLVM